MNFLSMSISSYLPPLPLFLIFCIPIFVMHVLYASYTDHLISSFSIFAYYSVAFLFFLTWSSRRVYFSFFCGSHILSLLLFKNKVLYHLCRYPFVLRENVSCLWLFFPFLLMAKFKTYGRNQLCLGSYYTLVIRGKVD